MSIHNRPTQKLTFLLREISMNVALLINNLCSATAMMQNYFVN